MGAFRTLRPPWSWLSARWHSVDRLVRWSALSAFFGMVCFGASLIHPVGLRALLWLGATSCGVMMVAVFWRTAGAAALPHIRRFWRHLTICAALVSMGSTAQAVDVLSTPHIGGPHVSQVMQILDGTGVLLIIYALYRLPMGQQSLGEAIRVILDAGTVLLATAVFMWHFSTRQALESGDRGALYGSVALTMITLLAVFAVAKVVLSRHSYVNKSALQLCGAAMLVGALGPLTQEYLAAGHPGMFSTQLSTPICFFIAVLGGERERRAQFSLRRGGAEAPKRSFSVLPYVAVAAVDVLLIIVTLSEDHSDQAVVTAFSVVLTALVVLRQVTAFRDNGRLLGQLDFGASHDALTQLPNRMLFNKRLQQALTAPGDRPVAVALIDLDDFKEVNDTLGHEVGDLLLIAVAQRLAGCVRAEDTVARLGGDEFVVVLDNADPAAADLAAERMVDALRQPVLADGHELPIRASIGIADGRTGDEASLLLRHADIAMYAAKKIPGTVHLHYEGSMAAAGVDHAHLGSELREAIHGDQLFLLYQPIVALDDGRVVGAEALVRWAHPIHGTLAPDSFIPVAERTGLIVPLGRWVMRTAFRQLAAWVAEYGSDAPGLLNVNVSARDLREPDFAAGVAALLDEFGIAADRVTLEITETMALEPGQSVSNLHQLRALGVRISLDDFGTGHSTLTLLHDCPVDEIKLDRSFTQAPVDGRVPVASAVIHLAQALGLHAVAEGVETAEQAEQLTALGYIAAQGYYFARPMPPDKFSEILDSGKSLTPGSSVQPAWQMS